jgi:hypothetical protein
MEEERKTMYATDTESAVQRWRRTEPQFVDFGAFGVESGAKKGVPIYEDPAAVARTFKAIQVFLGVPVTGTWNKATHDAFQALVVAGVEAGQSDPSKAIPNWGTTPAVTAERLIELFLGFPVDEDAQNSTDPITSDPVYGERLLAYVAALGLPTENRGVLASDIAAHAEAMDALVAQLRAVVVTAETAAVVAPPGTALVPWYKRPVLVTGLVVGTVAVVTLLVLAARKRTA